MSTSQTDKEAKDASQTRNQRAANHRAEIEAAQRCNLLILQYGDGKRLSQLYDSYHSGEQPETGSLQYMPVKFRGEKTDEVVIWVLSPYVGDNMDLSTMIRHAVSTRFEAGCRVLLFDKRERKMVVEDRIHPDRWLTFLWLAEAKAWKLVRKSF